MMSQYAGDVRIVPADLFPVYLDLLPVAQRRPASGLVRPLSGPTDPNCHQLGLLPVHSADLFPVVS